MEPAACASRRSLRIAVAGVGTAVAFAAGAAPQCSVVGPARVPMLVELYTSEGCSSCPPADRWLSSLRHRPGVLALAFHVGYWDRLGWKDRFADPAHTRRQVESLRTSGARQPYTPQVIVDGADQPGWRRIDPPGAASRPTPSVAVTVRRDAVGYVAELRAGADAPQRLQAYWAVTEDRHSTVVRSGENGGATLEHDFVVREYLPVPAWHADPQAAVTLRFVPSTPADAAHPRRTHLVVVDAASGRPVQALAIAC